MRKHLSLCLPAMPFLLSIVAPAFPASVLRMSFERLLGRSDTVVYGRVIGVHSFWDAATRAIWTDTRVQVLDSPKGRASESVTITEPGGVIGDVAHLFAGVPRFGVNQEIVVFLYRSASRHLRITGLQQGVYLVATDPTTRTRIARPSIAGTETVFEEGHRRPPLKREGLDCTKLDDLLSSIRKAAGR
jgi:hypothetical protein